MIRAASWNQSSLLSRSVWLSCVSANLPQTAYLLVLCVDFCRIAFFLFFIQIFWVVRWLRMTCYVCATLSTAFHGAATIAQLVFAIPRPGQTWAQHILDPITQKEQTLAIPLAAVGFSIDVIIFLLPIRVVSEMRLHGWERLKAYLMFGTGAV